MKKLLTTVLFVTLAGVQMAQADNMGNFDVTLTFEEPQTQPFNSVFTGTFVYDFNTQAISNLNGTLSESMTGCSVSMGCIPAEPANLLQLSYNPVASSSNGSGVMASAFLLNTSTIFSNGTYDSAVSRTAGNSSGSNGNAYATIFVSTAQLSEAVGANLALDSSYFNNLYYGDCTGGGMMGTTTCMTGHGTSASAGSMGGYPISETVQLVSLSSPVPVPGAFWFFGSAIVGFMGHNRRKQIQA